MNNKNELKYTLYLTTDEENMFVEQNENKCTFVDNITSENTININPDVTYQEIDGFGGSFTDASAYLINQVLEEDVRESLMRALFDTDLGIGLSVIRNPMGSSDYSRTKYSYNDIEKDETDFSLNKFTINHDKDDIIPLTEKALEINKNLKILAAPWSAPAWMKSSKDLIGGQLLDECYEVYSKYFVKFIQEYKKIGLDIYALSPQNEPLFVPNNYPGMLMDAKMQAKFIGDYLGPEFEKNNINTKILCYDHNWDRPDYPEFVFNSSANKYVSGVAWHVYGGDPSAQSEVYEKFKDKEVYFTEASGGEWVPPFKEAFFSHIDTIIKVMRNHSRCAILWNMALDEKNGPVVPNFGTSTCRGIVTINQQTKELTYTLDYYALAHFSKFVKSGAVRIDSTQSKNVNSVSFKNVDNSIVVVLHNTSELDVNININIFNEILEYNLPKLSVASFCFKK